MNFLSEGGKKTKGEEKEEEKRHDMMIYEIIYLSEI